MAYTLTNKGLETVRQNYERHYQGRRDYSPGGSCDMWETYVDHMLADDEPQTPVIIPAWLNKQTVSVALDLSADDITLI